MYVIFFGFLFLFQRETHCYEMDRNYLRCMCRSNSQHIFKILTFAFSYDYHSFVICRAWGWFLDESPEVHDSTFDLIANASYQSFCRKMYRDMMLESTVPYR